MAVAPDDSFPRPASFGPGSVWADRSGHRSLVGRNQRGVEIPIGHGEGEINPGELLKLARAVAAGCTVERTVVPGVEVTHTVLGAEPPDAATLRTSAPQTADSDAPGTPESRPDEDTTPDEEPR